MMKSHNCVVPWIISDNEICTDKGMAEIYQIIYLLLYTNFFFSCTSAAINDTFWIAWNRVTNQRNDCFNPCMIVLTSVGGKNLITVCIHLDYETLSIKLTTRIYILGWNQQWHSSRLLLLCPQGDEDRGALLLHGAITVGRNWRLSGTSSRSVSVALRILGCRFTSGQNQQDRGRGKESWRDRRE